MAFVFLKKNHSHAAWAWLLAQNDASWTPPGMPLGTPLGTAPMQRGARFLQERCFPCSVALVLGRGGGPGSAPIWDNYQDFPMLELQSPQDGVNRLPIGTKLRAIKGFILGKNLATKYAKRIWF